jgi:molecular chaperone HscB
MSRYLYTMNYFDLFGIPITLKVDKSILAKKYFELQREFHPDFYTQSDESEQQAALEKSAQINKGLKVLQQQDATIQYVLKLRELVSEDEKYSLPPDFLMEMMELNEKLEEEDSKSLKKEVSLFENSLLEQVEDIIENYDNDSISIEKLEKLKEYYFKKKYLQRILDKIAD